MEISSLLGMGFGEDPMVIKDNEVGTWHMGKGKLESESDVAKGRLDVEARWFSGKEYYITGGMRVRADVLPPVEQRKLYKNKLNDLLVKQEIKANNIAVNYATRIKEGTEPQAAGDFSNWDISFAKGKVERLRESGAPIINAIRAKIAECEQEIKGEKE